MKPLSRCVQTFHLKFSALAASFGLLVALPASLEVYAQPCPSANYRLQTQAQVDAFPGGCAEVTGDVRIGPSDDVADLSPLASITTVKGVVSLTGNVVLTNVDGFSALTTVGDTLVIGGDLDHGRYNPALTNLDGFSALSSVGTLYISHFAGTRLVFSALTSVDNRVGIRENEALTYLDLSSLRFVDGWDLGIEYNVSLTHVDLSALIFVGGTIQIWNNDALANLDLPALTTLGKPGRNEARANNLNIWRNAAMSSVNLSQLETVETLAIHEDAALTRIDLPALRSAKSLYIVDNSSLTDCSCGLYSLISGGGVTGPITMHTNASSGDCNNNGADLVAGQCSAVGIEDQSETTVPTEFALYAAYPNPFNPATTISYALPQAADVALTVADVLGRVVRALASGTKPAGTYEVSFDATGLPSGIYFYRLEAGDYVETKRMVVAK